MIEPGVEVRADDELIREDFDDWGFPDYERLRDVLDRQKGLPICDRCWVLIVESDFPHE